MAKKRGLLKVILWGALISLLGTLPLGTLNIAAMQVSISEGWQQAIYFSLGVAFVEVLYVRISITAVNWIMKNGRLLRYMEWAGVLIVCLLAFASFWAAFHPGAQKSFVLQSKLPNFLLGISLSAINPLQIPFWFGWTTVLFTKKVLRHQGVYYNMYIIGIGIGTLTGLSIFVAGGHLLVNNLQASQFWLNLSIGVVFAITAIILIVKIFISKPLDQQVEQVGAQLENAELGDG